MTPIELLVLAHLAFTPPPVCTFAAPQGAVQLAREMFTCKARVAGGQHEGSILTDSNLVQVWKRGKGKQPDRYVGAMPCARKMKI